MTMLASAAIEIDGIYYNLDDKAKTAEVTSNYNKYSGSVVIPKNVIYEGTEYGVTSIGHSAFSSCRDLNSITIPNSVISIGQLAFNCCSLLDMFCYAENVPTTQSDAFTSSSISYATLHVPTGSVEAYKAASPWNKFKEIVALEDGEEGDLNGDGKVDIADVIALVNIITGK